MDNSTLTKATVWGASTVLLGTLAAKFIKSRKNKQAAAASSSSSSSSSSTSSQVHDPANGLAYGLTHQQFQQAAQAAIQWIINYRSNNHQLPVFAQVEPGYLRTMIPQQPPQTGCNFQDIMQDIDKCIVPGLTHWQSRNFFAYFKCHSSYESLLADMFSAAFNVVGFSWVSSPACTELEIIMLDWMAQLFALPTMFYSSNFLLPAESFHPQSITEASPIAAPHRRGGGVIQATASEASLVAVLSAKARVLFGLSIEEREKAEHKLVAYITDQTHFSLPKDFKIAGIPEHRVRRIVCTKDTLYAMSPEVLAETMKKDIADGLIPFFVCATFGTTGTTAIDPVQEIYDTIQQVAADQKVWLHIDAAYGGSFCVLPEYQSKMVGWDKSDSIVINAHKALLVGFDCSLFWVADKRWLLAALTLDPNLEPYLRNEATDSGKVTDLKDWQLPLGRRFRSLKLWFVLRSFGVEGLKAHAQQGVDLARKFETLVKEDSRFELVVPRNFSTVVFRLNGTDAQNKALLDKVNLSGHAYIISTTLSGQLVLRLAAGGLEQSEQDISNVWKVLSEQADVVLCQK